MNIIIDLMVETVIQIKSGLMVNVGASVRNIIYVKKENFGILYIYLGNL